MNREKVGLQSLPVQPMPASGSPNRRQNQMNTTPPPQNHQSPPFAAAATVPPPCLLPHQYEPPSTYSWNDQEFQDSSFCQLLMSGLVGDHQDHDKPDSTQTQKVKKLDDWEEQLLHLHRQSANGDSMLMKQEASVDSYVYGDDHNDESQCVKSINWSDQMTQSSCSNSCVTSLRSSESKSSSGSGRANKKAKVEPFSIQSTFKVNKAKLGDRITALHQMVSPFGKTDTASVLLEVMGYIRFLHDQIQVLCLPYLGNQLANMTAHNSDSNQEAMKNLRSRGLCLIPLSYSMQVGNLNGGDYWLANNIQL